MQNIESILIAMAEPDFKKFSSALLPGVDNMIGVRLPKLRALAKEIAKENWREFLVDAADASFEERMLQGMVIGAAAMPWEERRKYIRQFVLKIDNWSVCDSFVSSLKQIKDNREDMLCDINAMAQSQKEFEVRFAAVALLWYYIDEEWLDKSLEIILRISHKGYYAQMAQAWALAMFWLKFPAQTEPFLSEKLLDKFVLKNAFKKIADSKTIKDEVRRSFRKRAADIIL